MPIHKIIRLQNIGRFVDLISEGDSQFRRLTLVYGLNGQGKTTIAGILRSLSTQDAVHIAERARLGVTEQPQAEILLAGGNRMKFASGAWTAASGTWHPGDAEFEIFDTTFVNDNVFAGEHVGPEHRKNLYHVVVGAAAVSLAREIDRLDSVGRDASRAINDAEARLQLLIHAPFGVDEFVELAPEVELEVKIGERTAKLAAVRKQQEVLGRRELELLAGPDVPDQIGSTLRVSVDRISEDAERAVRAHLQQHLDDRGEQWLRQGLDYLGNEATCPLCGQDTTGIELLGVFRVFFSNAYRDHLVDIESARNLLTQWFGDQALGALQRKALKNEGCIQGWADLADLGYARVLLDPVEGAWRHVAVVLREALDRKAANPGSAVASDPRIKAAVRDYQDAVNVLRIHNEEIHRANREIRDLKREAASTDVEGLEHDLRRLRNMQIRMSPEAEDLVECRRQALLQKKATEEAKKSKRLELEKMAKQVLGTYEGSINRLLQRFGATFTVTGTKPSFAGGKASSTYQIAINNVSLDLGDTNTPKGTPCFRTALSTGDKSTLALAFFLARLEHDSDIDKKTVVFDDPLSSLDCFRRACTEHEIARVAGAAAQTVVLSHDPFFLKQAREAAGDRKQVQCLQVARRVGKYVLCPWDVDEHFLQEAHHEYFLMKSYLDGGGPTSHDLTSVARAIRPYLEGHFRSRYPDQFLRTEWLGDIIQKIRNAGAGGVLEPALAKLSELSDVNEFSKRFHHKDQPVPQTNDIELQSFVARALKIVQA